MGRVLIIAGSDSSGGAGIQADIKTVSMLGGYAATAITAVTVQNTLGVTDVHSIPTKIIAAQIEAVLSDIGADAVKTGMLQDVTVIETVAASLDEAGFKGALVVDPVMVATSGDMLQTPHAVEAMKTHLIAKADIVTPNIPEAERLTGQKIESREDMAEAADKLLGLGAKAVLIKGGHMAGNDLVDYLKTDDDEFSFRATRIDTRHTHGTGCTLASAIATALAKGTSLDQAVREAHGFVRAAILAAPGYGQGHGPLGHAQVETAR